MSWFNRTRAVTQSMFRLSGSLPQPLKTPFANEFAAEYHLDSGTVDVQLARALYQNTEPRYKLGAGFARPAINIPVGFMGVPFLSAEQGGEAEQWLTRLRPQWSGEVIRAHRAAMLDGEVLVRLRPINRSPAYSALYGVDDRDPKLDLEPAESFEVITEDEDLGAITAVRVKHIVLVNENGHLVEKYITETITAQEITYEYSSNWKPKRVERNPYGFVPAVVLRNGDEAHELHGRSELEPLEPYMHFYHDVMLHAGAASKLHSTAKLILRVQSVQTFLQNNFTDAEITDNRLRFRDKDVLFFETGLPDFGQSGTPIEGADIIQATAPLGDTNTLLEYIFLNIVDVSEVPEWAFGGAIASSKASVTEQSAPLVHKVQRKRTLFENSWALVGRMALKMLGFSSRVGVEWDNLAQKDNKAEAEALKARAEALIALIDTKVISKYTAAEELRALLPALLEYIVEGDDAPDNEEARIVREMKSKLEQTLQEMQATQAEDEAADQEAGLQAAQDGSNGQPQGQPPAGVRAFGGATRAG